MTKLVIIKRCVEEIQHMSSFGNIIVDWFRIRFSLACVSVVCVSFLKKQKKIIKKIKEIKEKRNRT